MTLLVIDTAANLCAVCLWQEGRILASQTEDIGTGHAERLMGMIEALFTTAGKTYADLDRIGVIVGPGSFTGIRVGVSTARGLALALGVPAVGVTTLEGLATEAASQHPQEPVLAVIDARRDHLYSALYDRSSQMIAEPAVLDVDATLTRLGDQNLVLTGSGSPALKQALPDVAVVAEAATAGIETYAKLASQKPVGAKPVPLYLRGADAKPQASFVLPAKDETLDG